MKKSLIIVSLFISTFTWSYDAVGHRIISEIAYKNLNIKAKKHCDKLLGKHGIIYESTWADEVRSDKKYDYSYQWHYQNLKDSLTTNDLFALLQNNQAEGDHLFYAIDLMTKRLKDNPKDAEALKFLVHFVADLHQPMHLGRFEDLGGNKISVNWFGKTTNIHAVWDGMITENRKMSYSEFSQYLQDKFKPRKKEFVEFTVLQSIEAGYLIRNEIYNYDKSNTNNYQYIYRFSDNLDEMLYRGGIQLANILNDIF